VYLPALLKPAAGDLLLLLWSLYSGEAHGLDLDALPARPQQGLTSVEADKHIPESYWRAAGFRLAGSRAVRIDMLERLSDLIRARIAYRPAEGVTPPLGATGDGGFRVVPELMSVVGCSGEDFASILKALGFRRERRPLAVLPETTVAEPPGSDSGKAPVEVFDEIWRPGKRKDTPQHGRRPAAKAKHEARGQRSKPQGQRPQAQKPRPERKRAIEHSPFAVLEALKGRLTSRQPEGS
jgi:ATP-dependent RNA helicase SUPV3L1/SUV3